MRKEQRLQIAAVVVMVVTVALLLAVVLVVGARKEERTRRAEAAAEAARLEAERSRPRVVDPWAGQEQASIQRVLARTIDGREGSTSVERRVAARALEARVDLFEETGTPTARWVARRAEGSVYEVIYQYAFHGVEFGPRFFVQLDPHGPQPSGSQGVVPVNALARQLVRTDLDEDLRYLNRSDEIVEALTQHRFDSGVRLGSALLIRFLGDGEVTADQVIGWTVVPHEIDTDGELVYLAYFQWMEGETLEDAIWQVAYRGGQPSFRARDRRADSIMTAGADLVREGLIDIRPVSMRDLDQPASAERDPRVRALRYVLDDERIVEAVGALLAFRAQSRRLDYVQWYTNYDEGSREWCEVEYRYREDGRDRTVSWRVQSNTGERVPTNLASTLAEVALRPHRPNLFERGDSVATP
jgi:hypothetical protein